MCMRAVFDPEDDVETIVASNVSPPKVISPPDTIEFANAVMPATPPVAITDSGATQIFIMEGTPVNNKRPTDCPLKVALADGRRVMSTHICDVDIPGLPVVLTGHIIPELSIASLFGIRVLTDVGCIVTFDIDKCVVTLMATKSYADTRRQQQICGLSPSVETNVRPPSMTRHAFGGMPQDRHRPHVVPTRRRRPHPCRNLCPHSQNESQQHQVCPSSVLQPTIIDIP
jgi:hypothetical protein